MFVLNAKLCSIRVINFGGILRFELGFFICVFAFFCFRNLGWLSKVQWQHCVPPEAYAMYCLRLTCNAVIYPS